jgi:hypothetical protein
MEGFLKKHLKATVFLTAFVMVFLACTTPGMAFHCGYHFDLSRDLLNKIGFRLNAIKYIQICNYYDDVTEFVNNYVVNQWFTEYTLLNNCLKGKQHLTLTHSTTIIQTRIQL